MICSFKIVEFETDCLPTASHSSLSFHRSLVTIVQSVRSHLHSSFLSFSIWLVYFFYACDVKIQFQKIKVTKLRRKKLHNKIAVYFLLVLSCYCMRRVCHVNESSCTNVCCHMVSSAASAQILWVFSCCKNMTNFPFEQI